MGRQDSVIAHHVQARRGHQRANAREQILRREDDRDRAVPPGLLQTVAEVAAWELFEALVSNRRTAEISAQPLETGAIACCDANLSMHAEPLDRRGTFLLPSLLRIHDP